MARPIAIDLFAGAGGLSLGFEQAGFDVVAAVEIDPIHACVHKFNFPNCAVLPRSVTGLSAREIREAAGIGDRTVDVVVGGAPCQGFSLIGQRALDDPRNELVKEFVRLVCELGAKHFVFENVKGLTVGKHKKFLNEIISAFEAGGYVVERKWKVLNAAHYGVPQNRQRLFLLGSKIGHKLPEYPEPQTNISGGSVQFPDLSMGPSCRDALEDLPDAERYERLLASDSVRFSPALPESEYARELRCVSNDAWYWGYVRNWDANLLTSSLRTDHTELSRMRFLKTEEGQIEPVSRFFKLPSAGVSNTLRAGTDATRGAFTSPRPIHYHYGRCVTVREMLRLHGYPDWFRAHSTKWHGARQVGNSVPPPLARAVAKMIFKALGIAEERPQEVLNLGDEKLLTMDLTCAAKFWNIENPIAPRTRTKNTETKQKDLLVAAE